MKIDLIRKLISLQESKVNALKKDYQTLLQLTESLESKLKLKQRDHNELVGSTQNQTNTYFADSILNTALYLKQVNEEISADTSALAEAVKQKDDALVDLNDARVELKMLEKIVENAGELQELDILDAEQKNMDLIAMTQYNRKVA